MTQGPEHETWYPAGEKARSVLQFIDLDRDLLNKSSVAQKIKPQSTSGLSWNLKALYSEWLNRLQNERKLLPMYYW